MQESGSGFLLGFLKDIAAVNADTTDGLCSLILQSEEVERKTAELAAKCLCIAHQKDESKDESQDESKDESRDDTVLQAVMFLLMYGSCCERCER